MILSRTPTRITLGGGATDLKSYYANHGGFLIAGAIDKYCTIVANKKFEGDIRVSYSKTETVDRVADIEHGIFRAALDFTGVDGKIELHSIADVPANTGLGSSSSFTVSLLNALHAYKGERVEPRQLAEEACRIEIDILGEPIGKQDQYMAAFGGLRCLTFEKDGRVIVESLRISRESLARLEENILLFYTGKRRTASEILLEQDEKCKDDNEEMLQNLHKVKELGLATRDYLENGKLDMLGELMHVHWEIKKQRSRNMSDPFVDECYQLARQNGAVGGKLIGAGGGGFLMLYCNKHKTRLVEAMRKTGLRPEGFHFDFDGAQILVDVC